MIENSGCHLVVLTISLEKIMNGTQLDQTILLLSYFKRKIKCKLFFWLQKNL